MAWVEKLLTDEWLSSALGVETKVSGFEVLEAEGNSSSQLVKVQRQGEGVPALLVKATQRMPDDDALAASVDREALFYRDAWQAVVDSGAGLLQVHAVDIRPDVSLIVLEFVGAGWPRARTPASRDRRQMDW